MQKHVSCKRERVQRACAKPFSPKLSPASSCRKIRTTNLPAFSSNEFARSGPLQVRRLQSALSGRHRSKMEPMSVDLVATRVITNPQVRSGQPIIRGTRITVWDILGWLGGGLSESA